MTVLWGISILLCMSFPLNFGDNARLDIRLIPLLFGTLYGGFWPGLILSALVIFYRLNFGISIGFQYRFRSPIVYAGNLIFSEIIYHFTKR